jgi:hypothetical protein
VVRILATADIHGILGVYEWLIDFSYGARERLRQSYGCKQTRSTRKGRPHGVGFESSLVRLEVFAI